MSIGECASDVKLLDCTLRDGGYYNKWDFNLDLVNRYLDAVAQSKIDFVELGLRNFPKAGFLGPFAYTTESFLNRLDLPLGPVYGVMVDSQTILSSSMSVEEAVDTLFVNAQDSKVGLVRIASHFHEVEKSAEIASCLKRKGYIVGFNLMQAGGKPSELISSMAKLVHSWECVDALYFADSLGNMDVAEVSRIITALRLEWSGELGIHAHNNMGQAVTNTVAAAELGALWLDCTVTGMGRGAGNAQTENLLTVLSEYTDRYAASSIYRLVIRDFESMQKSYGWGSSLLYFLGAQNNIHPTYIQSLLSNTHYGTEEVVGAIDYLSDLEGTNSYDSLVLEAALTMTKSTNPVSGTTDLEGLFTGRNVLILGSGESLSRYKDDIINYIVDYKPVVLSVNVNSEIPADYISYYCVSHNSKFLSEGESYSALERPVILPAHRFTEAELDVVNSEVDILDYGLDVQPGKCFVGSESCALPYDLTVGYAFSACAIGMADNVFLVGVDGYERGDYRQLEMINLLELFKSTLAFSPIALTPTTYPLQQSSVYAPNI